VPRFGNLLADKIEAMGGVHTMILSHRDDVGEHEKWKVCRSTQSCCAAAA
jgi:hypothetical protein